MKAFLFIFAAVAGLALAVGSSHVMAGVTLTDQDLDGVPDEWDNCLVSPNPSQNDTNGDGYGNRCDYDVDNNTAVGITDITAIAGLFGMPNADADFDEPPNGVVGITDVTSAASAFGTPEGAGVFVSGLACADATGATAPCSGV